MMEGTKCGRTDCTLCETCIYDVDLFADGVATEKKNKTDKNIMKPICNYCGYLTKSYTSDERRFFNACCLKKLVVTGSIKRPMVIDYHTYEMADIERPAWCPQLAINGGDGVIPPINTQAQQNQLALPNKTEENTNVVSKAFKDMTYYEKKEELKKLSPRISWDDIKEDGYYLLPRIMSSPKKIIHVESKTNECIRYHEVSELTGNEYSYATTIYPKDVEAVFIVKIHEF